MVLRTKRVLLNAAALNRTLDRMALEIVERNGGTQGLALVGIHTAGVPLAQRLRERISRHGEVDLGMIDITLYRDDAFIGLPHPIVGATELPFDVGRRHIVLVDDVLYTGRTVRAALDAVIDFGRPRGIQLAVLVDRGHRELPIQPDIVGLTVQTTRDETVTVLLTELSAETDVVLLEERR